MSAKYCGNIGYAIMSETAPDVYSPTFVEKPAYGDVIKDNRRIIKGEGLNDDISITNQLSIISDNFALDNFSCMIYATYLGKKWKITSVDISYPRMILTLGGLYNA